MPAAGRVVIADAYPHIWGGSHLQTLLLLEGLAAEGFESRLVTPRLGVLTYEAASRGIPVTVVPATGPLMRYERQAGAGAVVALPPFWLRVRHALQDADLLHANDHRGVLMTGPAARSLRLPVVWHVHARAAGRLVDRLCARAASALVVPTAASGADLRSLGRPLHVVPGAVPPPTSHWTGANSSRLVTVGRLYRSKGLHILLDAVARVRRRVPDVTLDVIGGAPRADSPILDELAAKARQLGVADAVTFHGHLRDPWRRAASAGVYVQASTGEETQGLALREALLIGMPVVATDLPAWEDLQEDALRRVPPGDGEALADAIVAALLDPPREPSAPQRSGTVATDDGLVAAFAAIYRQLLPS